MAKTRKEEKSLSPKKQVRQQVAEQIQAALPGLRDVLGDEEFENRIRKASKLLAAGIDPVKSKSGKSKAKNKPAIDDSEPQAA